MSKIYIKKFNIILISFIVLFSNFATFADANIIYAPTKEQTIPNSDTNQVIPNSETSNVYTPSISNMATYEPASIDYDNIYPIIEIGNNFYCYDGIQYVTNGWRKISKSSFAQYAPVDGHGFDFIWAYFANNGHALKANSGSIRKVKIGNYAYAFNEYGQLLTGFFNDNGDMWFENDSEDPFDLLDDKNSIYHASESSGALTSGWYKLNNNTSRYPNKNSIWLYFNPTTYKITRSTSNNYKSLTVDGKTYAFDDNGVMLTGFEASQYNEEHGGSSKVVYFGDDGAEIKNGFYNVNMDDDENFERYEEYEYYDDDITIYLSKNGQMYKNIIKKINSSYYGFDQNGVVLKGLTIWNGGNYIATIDTESTIGKSFIMSGKYFTRNGGSSTLKTSDSIHYFDQKGKRVTTNGKIEFSDMTYTYSANNNGAFEGLHNSKYYVHGLLIKPDEGVRYGVYITSPTKTNYTMAELVNTNNVIINSNGSAITSKTVQRDENDDYWLISNKSLVNIYSVPIKISGSSYYFQSTNSNGNDEWIPFGEKDRYGRTCVVDVLSNGTKVSGGATSFYQVRLSSDNAINFNIS